jgi:hypothetical protein
MLGTQRSGTAACFAPIALKPRFNRLSAIDQKRYSAITPEFRHAGRFSEDSALGARLAHARMKVARVGQSRMRKIRQRSVPTE